MKKIGRNDLCPCGSNLKYKFCCLNNNRRIASESTIMTALQHHQAGKYDQAEAICRQLLDKEPNNPDALHLSGMIAHQIMEYGRSVELMNRSIRLSPEQPVYHCNLGNLYKDMKRFDEAISSYQKALALDPENVETLNNMGITFKELGKLDEAITAYQKAIILNPAYAVAHFNLGDAQKLAGKPDEAMASYEKSFKIDPKLASIMNNAGLIYLKAGLLDDAKSCFQELVAIKPDYAGAYVNLGIVFYEQGRLDEAIDSYRRAIEGDPDYIAGYNNLGIAYYYQGKFDEAIDVYRKAITLNPNHADSYHNMGNALKNRCRFDEAIASYEKALSIKPDHAIAFCSLLLAYQYVYAVSNEEVFARSVEFGRRFDTATRPGPELIGLGRGQGGVVRVGLVSADLGNHPVGFFLESALRHMDRDAFTFIAYANQFHCDDLSERIKPLFSDWVWVRGMTDTELAARIQADGIDILVDLSGHTADNRLPAFALKPAPVQVTWIGYANTTGMTSIDYILADPITVPVEEEKFYTEKVWRLPETYLCFTPPDVDVSAGALPVLENGRFTFGCFNNSAKINDTVIACWARIMEAVPDSQLFLKFRAFAHQSEREEFIRRFHASGIDADRIRFEGQSSRSDYLAAYHQVDMVLDPFPFPGATTTCEAAWMGVPTLTLRMARGIVGHNGELIMKSMGLDDWVAGTIDEYVEKAQTFAKDREGLAALRSQLRQRLLSSPLCDGERFAGHLAQAFTGMLGEVAAS